MSELNEDDAIATVLERLAGRFPAVERRRIETVVNEAREHLADGPIRDFVPVLVEHESFKRLRKEAKPISLALANGEAVGGSGGSEDQAVVDPTDFERRSQSAGPLLGDLGGSAG